jgi:hypothetical protein
MSISDEDLETARRIAAEVVQVMGERYWPLFELLDSEHSLRRTRRERFHDCLQNLPGPGPRRRKPRP